MPREVTAYLCAYRCGGRACLKAKTVAAHEARCTKNPARRACKTCAHNTVERADPPDYSKGYPGAPGCFGCEIDALPSGVVMALDCAHWAPKD